LEYSEERNWAPDAKGEPKGAVAQHAVVDSRFTGGLKETAIWGERNGPGELVGVGKRFKNARGRRLSFSYEAVRPRNMYDGGGKADEEDVELKLGEKSGRFKSRSLRLPPVDLF